MGVQSLVGLFFTSVTNIPDSHSPPRPAQKHGKYGSCWSAEKVMAETKNLDLLMDRCWYGLAGTIFKDGTECFWEINWWDGQEREGKRIFTNQTIVTVNGDWLPSDR